VQNTKTIPMKPNELNPWKIIDKQTAYNNDWIEVTHHNVLHSSGKNGVYGTVHFKKLALGVLVLDEENNTWIVGQYRFPLNQYTWEIPEGGGLLDVDPLTSIKRELLEETGIKADLWIHIQSLQLSNSATDEIAHLYVAKKLTYQKPKPDEDEILQQRKITFDKLYEWVCSGKVTDALTVTAVLKVKLMMLEGKL
jgi:8-oxo-dGTP pyrophosphatase MutT (NUDIX family)